MPLIPMVHTFNLRTRRIIKWEETVFRFSLILRFPGYRIIIFRLRSSKSQWLAALVFWSSSWTSISVSNILLTMLHVCIVLWENIWVYMFLFWVTDLSYIKRCYIKWNFVLGLGENFHSLLECALYIWEKQKKWKYLPTLRDTAASLWVQHINKYSTWI